MTARWVIVLVTAALLVAVPLGVRHRPAAENDIPATELAGRIQASGEVPWSGLAETSGGVQLPDSDSFVGLAQLLGEDNELRVWWRTAEDWRIDRVRSTGETDLFRQGQTMVRWVFESETATITPVSRIRLPDASDLLPPTLARLMLQGVRPDELSRLPVRRIAGLEAPGLRLVPAEPASTVARVDIWADPASGLPVQVELYATDERRPVLSTTLRELRLDMPAPELTDFRPASDITINFEESVDVAAAANAFAPYDLPAMLAGLTTRNGDDPAAVGVYGRGPTTVMVLPLRRQVAGPLRARMRESAGVSETDVGTLAPVGPVGLLLTPRTSQQGPLLLTGTVTAEYLQRAAAELLNGS
jgi:hypothetical protein